MKAFISENESKYLGKELSEQDKCELWHVISILQHERLIHLMITIATAVVFFVVTYLMILFSDIVTDLLFLAVTIVLIFYIKWYCYLENETQKFEKEYFKE